MTYQRRIDGMISEWDSFREAIGGPYGKVSFELENGRLMLYSDGTWAYRTEVGEYRNGNFARWEDI